MGQVNGRHPTVIPTEQFRRNASFMYDKISIVAKYRMFFFRHKSISVNIEKSRSELTWLLDGLFY